MNLNSLPDEMFTNVLKYIDKHQYEEVKFSEILKLRKINERIDRLARKAKLTRISTSTFVIRKSSVEFYVNDKLFDDEREGLSLHISGNEHLVRKAVLETANKYIQKVKITGFFGIEEMNVDYKLLALARTNKLAFRSLINLSLIDVSWELPIETSKEFICSLCPKIKRITIHKSRGIQNIVNKEVLGNRKWDRLWIIENLSEAELRNIEPLIEENSMLEKYLNDEFLIEVVANTKWFRVPSFILKHLYHPYPIGTSFTLHGVINLLHKCSVNCHLNIQHDLGVVELGNVPFNKVEKYVVLVIPDTKVITAQRDITREYTVKFNKERTSRIRFEIFAPRRQF